MLPGACPGRPMTETTVWKGFASPRRSTRQRSRVRSDLPAMRAGWQPGEWWRGGIAASRTRSSLRPEPHDSRLVRATTLRAPFHPHICLRLRQLLFQLLIRNVVECVAEPAQCFEQTSAHRFPLLLDLRETPIGLDRNDRGDRQAALFDHHPGLAAGHAVD